MSFVLKFIGQWRAKTGYSSNWWALHSLNIILPLCLSSREPNLAFAKNLFLIIYPCCMTARGLRKDHFVIFTIHFSSQLYQVHSEAAELMLGYLMMFYHAKFSLTYCIPCEKYCTTEGISSICLIWNMPFQQSFSTAVKTQHRQVPWRQWIHDNKVPGQLLQFICACGTFPQHLWQWHWLPCIQLDVPQDLYGPQ